MKKITNESVPEKPLDQAVKVLAHEDLLIAKEVRRVWGHEGLLTLSS